jgi:hypothetical protein
MYARYDPYLMETPKTSPPVILKIVNKILLTLRVRERDNSRIL